MTSHFSFSVVPAGSGFPSPGSEDVDSCFQPGLRFCQENTTEGTRTRGLREFAKEGL